MAFSKLTRDRMLDWIRSCIDKGIPAPTDAEIEDYFGFDGPERGRTLLAELADRGEITIQRRDGERVGIALGRKAPEALAGVGRPTPTIKTAQAPKPKDRLDIMRGILARKNKGDQAADDDAPAPTPREAAALAPVSAPTASQAPPASRAPRSEKPGGVRQITFNVDPETYDLLASEGEKAGLAPGRIARDRFFTTLAQPAIPATPAKKPLISAAVAAAAVERGQPLHEFVAALIQIGFAEHKRQTSSEVRS